MKSRYKLKFLNKKLERMLTEFRGLNDLVKIELQPILTRLREHGTISEADLLNEPMPGPDGRVVPTEMRRARGYSFDLLYQVEADQGVITILDLGIQSWKILTDSFSVQFDAVENEWDMTETLPQCDPPQKLIRALQLIYQGISDAHDLGYELGHRAKKRQDIQRHGNYTTDALAKLNLVERYPVGRHGKLEIHLTQTGKRIAVAKSPLDQERYLIEAMLHYPPLWQIMREVTEGRKSLTTELIISTVIPEADRESQTAGRRAAPLRRWVEWIAEMTLIPIQQGRPKAVTPTCILLRWL